MLHLHFLDYYLKGGISPTRTKYPVCNDDQNMFIFFVMLFLKKNFLCYTSAFFFNIFLKEAHPPGYTSFQKNIKKRRKRSCVT